MCGRYSLVCIDDLGRRFRIHDPMLGIRSRFNIAPLQQAPVVVRRQGRNAMVLMEWGLAAGSAAGGAAVRPINARAETLAERPAFRDLLRDGRCLVPATGFFEWRHEGGRKIPFHIRLKGRPVFAFAGLCTPGSAAPPAAPESFTIITTRPNTVVAPLHERMPAILQREDEDRWLEEGITGGLQEMLAPYPPEEMEAYAVSSRVNDPKNDDEGLTRPLPTL